jgi:hypothetical protein
MNNTIFNSYDEDKSPLRQKSQGREQEKGY